ncbi:hypothetical protein [Marinovum sp.]|uniref:hypothetical protein n=1 Tax=Marinovum sp. TaxID=2024839 RepID=UPI002B272C63|nr:hypothetical protein [Marinovum sp.]
MHLPVATHSRRDVHETRLRRDITRLHARRPRDTGQTVRGVTLTASGAGAARSYLLSVTADNGLAAEVELARMSQAIVARYPVTGVGWLNTEAVIDRQVFLDALAPRPTRPRQSLGTARARGTRPAQRLKTSDAQRQRETLIRRLLCDPIPQEETRRLRRELGQLGPSRRVATATFAFGVTVAANTTGALAQVMSLF